jgi:hypothetical protein
MPEDAGKKQFIRDFLENVKSGQGLVEDIRIERIIKQPGTEGLSSMARSLSGREISNITQMLEDDLKHCFEDGFFTFRVISALVGSGKTSFLTYLYELISIENKYKNNSVTIRFKISDLLNTPEEQNFGSTLYCHILASTFWQLLNSKDSSVSEVSKTILNKLLNETQFGQLTLSNDFELQFYPKFTKYTLESSINLKRFFFKTISKIIAVNPKFTFVYLIDELDSLEKFSLRIEQTHSLFKDLIKEATEGLKSKLRLFIYLVGTPINLGKFLSRDSVMETLISKNIVHLNRGSSEEFELIKCKINERIKGAYHGYKDFPEAWTEIQQISFPISESLRQFCQDYALAVLEIHEKYFQRLPEQKFEGDARALVKSECEKEWASLSKSTCQLSEFSTTKILSGHAFDCYVELLHNGKPIARAFGEAKNYPLLSSHLETFEKWLKDVNFNYEAEPPELAFLIAPSCSSLLKRKIELANIRFIQAEKIIPPPPPDPKKIDEREKVLKEPDNKTIDQGIRTKEFHEILESKKITLSERRIQEIAKANKVPSEWGYRAAKIKNQWRWFPL